MTTEYVRPAASRPTYFDRVTSNTIWRYQDLTKLLGFLTSGCLWFPRADGLGDPYEGSSVKASRTALIDKYPGPDVDQILSDSVRAWIRNSVINSWHMSDHESEAMWKLYVSAGQGIAVRSTIARLMGAFPSGEFSASNRDAFSASTRLEVHFGAVRYIDHHQDDVDVGDTGSLPSYLATFFFKRKSFEHEREFRAVIHDDHLLVHAFPPGGVAVPVNVATLIEAIHVPPGAPVWIKDVVEKTLALFGNKFQIPVKQSRLDEDPIF